MPHVDPRTRGPDERRAAAVTVESHCGGVSQYNEHIGQGVVISERYVLTAQHVVRCAEIPRVYVTTSEGYRTRMYVVREDDDNDIAKLEVAHAGRLGLNIPPPVLDNFVPFDIDYLCAERVGEPLECGQVLETTDTGVVIGIRLEHGDSGAGVYRLGSFAGLVIQRIPYFQGLRDATRVTRVDATWLDGT